jgi:hypothetical protein
MFKSNELKKDAVINFCSIQEEFTFLCVKRNVYYAFLSKANVLWEASEITYSIFMDSIRDDLIITISRLTDNSQEGKNKNSTILRLKEDLNELISSRSYGDSDMEEYKKEKDNNQLEKFNYNVNELNNDIKNLKIIRNKRKAHRDLNTLIKEYEDKKKNSAKDDVYCSGISESIVLIGEILTIFASIVFRTHIMQDVVMPLKGVNYFIQNLEEGNKWRKKKIEENLSIKGFGLD